MANPPISGRSLVTERAVRDIVRTATLGSYGVTGFAAGPIGRVIERLGLGQPGLDVRLDGGIRIDLELTVALGVPVAEVARQLDSSIRYAIRRALDRDVTRLAIHIDGLHVPAGGGAPVATEAPATAPARGGRRNRTRRPAARDKDLT